MIELGARLRTMRKASGLTLKQVTEQTGISFTFLSDVETGRAYPSFPTLQKLANCYGQTITVSFVPSDWSNYEI